MSNQSAFYQFVNHLAIGSKVLLVGNDFDLLQLLAMTQLKELVIFDKDADPDAPDGQTPLGALLRFRADLKERPSSKDLIIDMDGNLSSADVEKLLKKAGRYICGKKRRFNQFLTTPIEAYPIQAVFFGDPNTTPHLTWSTAMSNTPSDSATTGWIFSKTESPTPTMVISDAWGHAINPIEISARHELEDTLQRTVLERDRATEELREIQDEFKTAKSQIAMLQKENNAANDKMKALQEQFQQLENEKIGLERENDELSVTSATLKADEKRFQRLQERFDKFRSDSEKEVEGLQNQLRSLAVAGEDVRELVEERKQLTVQLEQLSAGFDDLFRHGLGDKRMPKLPPVRAEGSNAPMKLWLAKAETLLLNQQESIATLTTENKKLKNEKIKLEKQVARSGKSVTTRTQKALSVSINAYQSSEREQELQTLLEVENRRNVQLEKSIQATLKRVSKVNEAYSNVLAQIAELQSTLNDERGLRLAAEADQALLREELRAKHAELEERAGMVDTYASLQQLLSESLRSAEDARRDAEDGRRLADENLRILQREFERLEVGR